MIKGENFILCILLTGLQDSSPFLRSESRDASHSTSSLIR